MKELEADRHKTLMHTELVHFCAVQPCDDGPLGLTWFLNSWLERKI